MLVDGPEPHLQARILAALEDKPLRLVRIATVRAQAADTGGEPLAGTDLAELDPHEVFAALFRRDYGGEAPPEGLARAFSALLVETETAGEED